MAEARTHFTAALDVTQTTHTPASASRYGDSTPESRDVSDVTRLVIRAGSIDDLATKLAAHINLLKESA